MNQQNSVQNLKQVTIQIITIKINILDEKVTLCKKEGNNEVNKIKFTKKYILIMYINFKNSNIRRVINCKFKLLLHVKDTKI